MECNSCNSHSSLQHEISLSDFAYISSLLLTRKLKTKHHLQHLLLKHCVTIVVWCPYGLQMSIIKYFFVDSIKSEFGNKGKEVEF